MGNITVEMHDYQKDDFPFILHRNVSSSFSRFYTNWHMELEVILILEGSETIFVDNDVYTAEPGDLLVINPGRIHTGTQQTTWRHHCLIPSMEFLESIDINPTVLTLQPLIRDQRISDLFVDIITEFEQKGPFRHALTMVAAERFFLQLFKNYSTRLLDNSSPKSSADFAVTMRVLNYLRQHFASDFPIDNVSREIGITTSYMCRCVKQTTGLTIVEHLNTIRCRAAYHYLAHSDKKVHEVAALCGFNGNSYFAKTFQRVIGIPPSAVRKSVT